MGRRRRYRAVLWSLIWIAGTAAVPGIVRTVDDDPGADFTSVQAAITASASGDEVQVSCGVYVENITMKDGVDVIGEGAGCTILDGDQLGSVVTFINIGAGTELTGFTIQNGFATKGAGLFILNSQATVSRSIIRGNTAELAAGFYGFGGGMHICSGSPTISNSLIIGNSAQGTGGGVDMEFAYPLIVNSTIIGNTVERPGATYAYGGGVYARFSDPTLRGNLIIGNTAEAGGGGVDLINSDFTVIEYTDIAQNVPIDISGTFSSGGGGNLSMDPQFLFPGGPTYCVSSNSPVLDAGPAMAPASPVDFFGRPRVQDGDFDGIARADLGYCESDEVTNLTMGLGDLVSWDLSINSAATFNLYRGLLSVLEASCATSCVFSQDPGLEPEARRECALPTPSFVDTDQPDLGDGYYYLATGEDLTEGGLGWVGSTARPHDNPCP